MTKQVPNPPSQEASGLAITSMVLGIASLLGPGFLLGIPAIITAAVALKKKQSGKGFSVTGMVTGIISTVSSLMFVALVVFLAIWGIHHPESFSPEEHLRKQPNTEHRFESMQS